MSNVNRDREQTRGAEEMKMQPTVHNPSNFEPRDYEVEDYLDNQRPQFFGQDGYEQELAYWKADMERILGADWRAKSHHCVHCGNGSVRWITAVRHLPTNEVVVFGAVCTDRLGFANKVAFKLAQLQARAEARKVKFTIYRKREQYLTDNPLIKQALAEIDQPQHAKNFFAQDVLRKLDQYGTLSTRQAECVIESLRKDNEAVVRRAIEAAEPKGDAPSGRVEVTGTVLTVKEQESQWGIAFKMLLKLANNSKVWLTCTDSSIQRGDTVTVKATFEVSRDDKSFAFGKRPIVNNIQSAVR